MRERLRQFRENREETTQSLQRHYLSSKGSESPFIHCPECYEESAICLGEYAGICTECENFFRIAACDRCGLPMVGAGLGDDGVVDLCEYCRARIDEE
jgi:hypothetical protein